MQPSRRKFNLPLVLCAVVMIVLPSYFVLFAPHGFSDRGHTEMRVKIDIRNYTAALTAYSNVYARLPNGDNATVTGALLGNNPEKHTFLHAQLPSINAQGEFLDPQRRPYDIEVTTNTIRINRRPK